MSVSQPERARNGRTKQENIAFAKAANAARSPEQTRAAAEAMQKGRRAAARRRIEERWGPQPESIIERLIDREISGQMAMARAKGLTLARKRREAAERAAAEDLDLDATGLLDAGEQ